MYLLRMFLLMLAPGRLVVLVHVLLGHGVGDALEAI
jgi:hypothetical protein